MHRKVELPLGLAPAPLLYHRGIIACREVVERNSGKAVTSSEKRSVITALGKGQKHSEARREGQLQA